MTSTSTPSSLTWKAENPVHGYGPAVFHEPDVGDGAFAEILLANLLLPYLLGIAFALHAEKLGTGELHAAPEHAAHDEDDGHGGKGDAAGMKGGEFSAVLHEMERHDGGEKEHGGEDLCDDGRQTHAEILKHESQS